MGFFAADILTRLHFEKPKLVPGAGQTEKKKFFRRSSGAFFCAAVPCRGKGWDRFVGAEISEFSLAFGSVLVCVDSPPSPCTWRKYDCGWVKR